MGHNLKKLSRKHITFVDYYLESYDVVDAARKAGFKGKYISGSANQMKRDPLIQLEIQKRWKELMISRGIEKQYLIDKLLMIIEEAEKRDDKGNMKLNTILKAIDQMAKLGGFYSDTNVNIQNNLSEIKIEIVEPDNVLELSDEDTTYIEIENKK